MKNDGDHRDSWRLLRWRFNGKPNVAAILPDLQLPRLLAVPITCQHAAARLWAELWTRVWLYGPGCPPELRSALDRWEWSEPFRVAINKHVLPLRHPHPDSDPRYAEVLRTPPDLNGDEKLVWDCIRRRVLDFLSCDGLLALVPPDCVNPADGVALPFRLTDAEEFRDETEEALPRWTSLLRKLEAALKPYYGVQVPDVFPREQEAQPDGSSFAVPLLLARERLRADKMPDFHPLDVLATGAFTVGKVQAVKREGVPAKRDLARRLGCRIFIVSAEESSRAEGDFFISPDTKWRDVLPELARNLPRASGLHRARQNLAACLSRIEIAQEGAQPEESDWLETWRQLNRCRRAFGTRYVSEAKKCMEATGYVEARLCLTSPHQHTHIEVWLADYRQRPIFGRGGQLQRLDDFVQNKTGGLQLLTGKSGYGKTALLAQWLRRSPLRVDSTFYHLFRADNRYLRDLDEFYHRLTTFLWLHGLGQAPPAGGGNAANNLGSAFEEYARLPERVRPRLLVVLDAVDEAEEPYFAPPFGAQIPIGIHIIASARTQAGDCTPTAWEEWRQASTEPGIETDSLGAQALTDWLASDQKLGFLARNTSFIPEVLRRTQGCPQFLQNFFEDLRQTDNIRKSWLPLLETTPSNYKQYIAKQFNASCALSGAEDLPKLTALLIAAKAPLSEADIERILDHNGQQAVRVNVHNLPNQALRWIGRDPTGNHGLCLRLGNALVREALEEVPSVKRWTQELKPLLREYCLKWNDPNYPSPLYALRHLAAHLADENAWSRIVATARALDYQAALHQAFPDEPAMLLQILREAMTVAARRDDVSGITEIMLAHADLAFQLKQQAARPCPGQSPSALARHKAKITAGWNPALSALWKLLLAWQLKRENQTTEADGALADLTSSGAVLLTGYQSDMAAELIPSILEPTDPRLFRIARLLLDEEGKQNLITSLARRNDAAGFHSAYALLRSMDPTANEGRWMRRARSAILRELAAAGHWGRAFNEARQEEPHHEGESLLEIARVAASVKCLDKLAEAASRITDLHESLRRDRQVLAGYRLECGRYRVALQAMYGRELVLAGRASEGYDLLAKAEELADAKLLGKPDDDGNRSGTPARVSALASLAGAWLGLPTPDHLPSSRSPTQRLHRKAFLAWRVMSNHPDNSNSKLCHRLAEIAQVYLHWLSSSKSGRLWGQSCLRRLASVPFLQFLSPQDRDYFLQRVVQLYAEQPSMNLPAAKQAVYEIEDPAKCSRAIALLASALAHNGGLDLLRDIPGSPWRAYYGLQLLEAGQHAAAFTAFAESLAWATAVPKQGRSNIQLVVTLAELGAAAAPKDKDLSEHCFNNALGKVRRLEGDDDTSLPRLWFLLDLAGAAHRAGNARIYRTALREAWSIGRQLAGVPPRDPTTWAETASPPSPAPEETGQDTPDPPKPRASSAKHDRNEVRTIGALCALAKVQYEVNQDTVWTFFDIVRERARCCQNIVQKTEAIADVSKTYRLMRRFVISVAMFQRHEDDVTRRLPELRGKGARRDAIFCLGELVLGLVKAGFPKWALAYANDPDLQANDSAQQAFAIGYIAAYDDTLQESDIDKAGAPQSARSWWVCPAKWTFSEALEKSREHLDRVRDLRVRERTLSQLAELHAQRDRPALALRAAASLELGQDQDRLLYRVGKAFAQSKDSYSFKKLLPSCAWSYTTTYVILGHLANLYPDQSAKMAEILERYGLLRKYLGPSHPNPRGQPEPTSPSHNSPASTSCAQTK